MNRLKIGLLAMYVKLYDDSWSFMRERVNAFHNTIINEFEKRNIDVVSNNVCRVKSEFKDAILRFEEEDVDAIITLHLAYSPSLESAEILADTNIPIIVLDTTPTFDYSPSQKPDELLYNHGIHGVQDMCNLLLRNGKKFFIEAGHWKESDVIERVISDTKACKLAKSMKRAKVGRVGRPFEGMGDFELPKEILESTIGIETIIFDFKESKELLQEISENKIEEEICKDINEFNINNINNLVHKQSTLAGLSIRNWIEKNELTAFTINFMEITKKSGIPSMPFLEASKAMARGIGYAGEGDVLTAALVGALLSVYPETSFTEMFCPDWKNNSIFLSHMGEMNLNLTAAKPVLKEIDFPFTDAENPIVAYGRFKSGKVSFINLAPCKNNSYSLIVSSMEMLEVKGEDKMQYSIHGWVKPSTNISDFLSEYSNYGGTHHGVIVYGDLSREMERFAQIMDWKYIFC